MNDFEQIKADLRDILRKLERRAKDQGFTPELRAVMASMALQLELLLDRANLPEAA